MLLVPNGPILHQVATMKLERVFHPKNGLIAATKSEKLFSVDSVFGFPRSLIDQAKPNAHCEPIIQDMIYHFIYIDVFPCFLFQAR